MNPRNRDGALCVVQALIAGRPPAISRATWAALALTNDLDSASTPPTSHYRGEELETGRKKDELKKKKNLHRLKKPINLRKLYCRIAR